MEMGSPKRIGLLNFLAGAVTAPARRLSQRLVAVTRQTT